ncbi:hypothetical protein JNUCC1_02198 [Lentibacillus sp. JNUCC-1]|uniref:hypothetical protein n=1 Tax=Lentibacillus sp. JNUCC-1 TaxID=2654513 RepID=UPI0012E88566|nr:hypothetical protein [Lentibacillus sp. JNUCC-1]MUV38360.1 hypothetical protein [Lentibacillus sp. JNUCC-1]
MNIHWHDWFKPTNSFSALILAVSVIAVVSWMVWVENKQNGKLPMKEIGSGIGMIMIVIMALSLIEFYKYV